MNEKDEKKVEEKKELTPMEQIQKAVDEKKGKDKGTVAEILDLPAPDKGEEKVEEKVEEKKEEKAEAKEEKKEEEKKEEGKEEEEVIDPLLAEVSRVSLLAAGHETAIQGEPEKKEEVKEEVKKDPTDLMAPTATKDIDYIGKETMGDTFEEKDVTSMNAVLNKVVKEGNKRARTQAFQDVLKVVPQIVNNIVKGHMAALEYWRKNPELERLANKKEYEGLRNFVAIKANEAQSKNPKFTLGQVYNQVDKEVRLIFGDRLKKKEVGKVDSEEKKKEVKKIPRKPGSTRPIPIVVDKSKGKSQQDQMGNLSEFIHGA